jgi:hypothetical protein
MPAFDAPGHISQSRACLTGWPIWTVLSDPIIWAWYDHGRPVAVRNGRVVYRDNGVDTARHCHGQKPDSERRAASRVASLGLTIRDSNVGVRQQPQRVPSSVAKVSAVGEARTCPSEPDHSTKRNHVRTAARYLSGKAPPHAASGVRCGMVQGDRQRGVGAKIRESLPITWPTSRRLQRP